MAEAVRPPIPADDLPPPTDDANGHESTKNVLSPADVQNQYLAQFGLTRVHIEGDDNCLFKAISYCLYNGDVTHYEELRANSADFIDKHRSEFNIHVTFTGKNQCMEDELERLRQTDLWAKSEALIALCRLMDVSIFLTSNNASNTRTSTMQYLYGARKSSIHIAYYGDIGIHYDAVVGSNMESNASVPASVQIKGIPISNPVSDHHSYAVSDMTKSAFICYPCKRTFANKRVKRVHDHAFHSGQKPKSCVDCIIPFCDSGFSSLDFMMCHLQTDHGANMKVTEHTFPTMDDFLEFKKSEEKKTDTLFVKKRAVFTTGKSSFSATFICHRDGFQRVHRKKGESYKGTRAPSKKGSCKINGICPSRLSVYQVKDQSEVSVKYIRTHAHSSSFLQSEHVSPETLIKSIKYYLTNITGQLDHPAIQHHRLSQIKESLKDIKCANDECIKLNSTGGPDSVNPIQPVKSTGPGRPKKSKGTFASRSKSHSQPRLQPVSGPGKIKKPRLAGPTEGFQGTERVSKQISQLLLCNQVEEQSGHFLISAKTVDS